MSLTKLNDLDIASLGQEALAELLPTAVKRAVEAIPQEIYEKSLAELERTIKGSAGLDHVPIDLCRTRIAFWLEFERHYRTSRPFEMTAVYGGLMTFKRFQKEVLGNSYWLAFMITPPTSYGIMMDEMLHYGLQFQREVLAIPHGKGKDTNIKLLSLKHQIIEGIHDRIKGLPTSRHLHVSKSLNSPSGEDAPRSVKDIDQKIKELEGTAINVTSTGSEE